MQVKIGAYWPFYHVTRNSVPDKSIKKGFTTYSCTQWSIQCINMEDTFIPLKNMASALVPGNCQFADKQMPLYLMGKWWLRG